MLCTPAFFPLVIQYDHGSNRMLSNNFKLSSGKHNACYLPMSFSSLYRLGKPWLWVICNKPALFVDALVTCVCIYVDKCHWLISKYWNGKNFTPDRRSSVSRLTELCLFLPRQWNCAFAWMKMRSFSGIWNFIFALAGKMMKHQLEAWKSRPKETLGSLSCMSIIQDVIHCMKNGIWFHCCWLLPSKELCCSSSL